VILFLDYDGVLHPDPCLDARRLFENSQRLADVVAQFPPLNIVLSTSWRTVRPESELLDPLPQVLRGRIIGQTPRFSDCSGARLPYRRQVECEQWLRTKGIATLPWWALDDRPDWFAPYCENLIECNARTGFDERIAQRLHSALTIATGRALAAASEASAAA
jgi:hypothetical protein